MMLVYISMRAQYHPSEYGIFNNTGLHVPVNKTEYSFSSILKMTLTYKPQAAWYTVVVTFFPVCRHCRWFEAGVWLGNIASQQVRGWVTHISSYTHRLEAQKCTEHFGKIHFWQPYQFIMSEFPAEFGWDLWLCIDAAESDFYISSLIRISSSLRPWTIDFLFYYYFRLRLFSLHIVRLCQSVCVLSVNVVCLCSDEGNREFNKLNRF